MANLTATAGKDNVYQIETTDLVQGGAGGIANDPHQDLLNRSELIFDTLDGTISNANIAVMGDITIMGDDGAAGTEEAFKVDTTTGGTRLTYISQQLKIWSDTGVEGGQLTLTDKTGAVDAWKIDVDDAGDFRIFDDTPNVMMEITSTEIVFNQSGIDKNIRMEGDTDTNLLFLDAGQDNIGVGTGSPTSTNKLEINSAVAGGTGIYSAVTGTGATKGGWFTSDSTTGRGVYGTSTAATGTCYGGFFSSTSSGGQGVYGYVSHASAAVEGVYGDTISSSTSSYGVRGNSTSGISVGGNTAYNTASDKFIKINKQEPNILDSIRNSNLQVQRWMYEDSNYKGFNEFISPMAQHIKDAFDLTFDEDRMFSVDGIALGGVIELLTIIDDLTTRIKILEDNK